MLNFLAYYLHDLNPVIFSWWYITPRWYGLSYLMGFLGAYLLLVKLQRDGMLRLPREKVADLVLNCCIFGVLIGGRLGYCLFYDLPNALKEGHTPLLWFTSQFPYWGFLRVWEGGMSAHGGVLFTILTLLWFQPRTTAQKPRSLLRQHRRRRLHGRAGRACASDASPTSSTANSTGTSATSPGRSNSPAKSGPPPMASPASRPRKSTR